MQYSLRTQLGGSKNTEESVQTTVCLAYPRYIKLMLTDRRDKFIRGAAVSFQDSKISDPLRFVKVWCSQQALSVVLIYMGSSEATYLLTPQSMQSSQLTLMSHKYCCCSYFQPQKGKPPAKSYGKNKTYHYYKNSWKGATCCPQYPLQPDLHLDECFEKYHFSIV